MAGMFYSLQEVIEKLNMTAEQIKQIVREGRLREFRDGPNLLFKIDEVEALASETTITEALQTPASAQEPQEPTDEPVKQPAEQPQKQPESQSEQQPAELPVEHTEEAPEAEISLAPEEQPAQAEQITQKDTFVPEQELSIAEETNDSEATSLSGHDLSEETTAKEDLTGETKTEFEDLSLGSGIGDIAEGDTVGETKAITDEASLEEIEEDVNLDSFGSGSGLLDLSLQADDTSLGGILDEIYTSEGEEEQMTPGTGSIMDATTQVDEMLTGTPEPQIPTAAQIPIEPEPDAISNALGIMLFLPLLAVIYTTIVTIAGLKGTMPAILESIQKIIWYITIGLVIMALAIAGTGFMLGSKGQKEPKKPKPPKKKKAKKEKKPKKEKKSK